MNSFSYNGFFRALVIDSKDPDNYGRVKVRIPDLMPDPDPNKVGKWDTNGLWAKPANNPLGGRNTHDIVGSRSQFTDAAYQGTSYIPPSGSYVWIFFEKGNPNHPYYFGSAEVGTCKVLPENQFGSNPHKKWVVLKSNEGRCIVVSDDPDDCRVQITGKKRKLANPPNGSLNSVFDVIGNQSTIIIDERDGKEQIRIEDYKGNQIVIDQGKDEILLKANKDIHLSAGGKIYFDAADNIEMKSQKAIMASSGDDVSVNAGKDLVETAKNIKRYATFEDSRYAFNITDFAIAAASRSASNISDAGSSGAIYTAPGLQAGGPGALFGGWAGGLIAPPGIGSANSTQGSVKSAPVVSVPDIAQITDNVNSCDISDATDGNPETLKSSVESIPLKISPTTYNEIETKENTKDSTFTPSNEVAQSDEAKVTGVVETPVIKTPEEVIADKQATKTPLDKATEDLAFDVYQTYVPIDSFIVQSKVVSQDALEWYYEYLCGVWQSHGEVEWQTTVGKNALANEITLKTKQFLDECFGYLVKQIAKSNTERNMNEPLRSDIKSKSKEASKKAGSSIVGSIKDVSKSYAATISAKIKALKDKITAQIDTLKTHILSIREKFEAQIKAMADKVLELPDQLNTHMQDSLYGDYYQTGNVQEDMARQTAYENRSIAEQSGTLIASEAANQTAAVMKGAIQGAMAGIYNSYINNFIAAFQTGQAYDLTNIIDTSALESAYLAVEGLSDLLAGAESLVNGEAIAELKEVIPTACGDLIDFKRGQTTLTSTRWVPLETYVSRVIAAYPNIVADKNNIRTIYQSSVYSEPIIKKGLNAAMVGSANLLQKAGDMMENTTGKIMQAGQLAYNVQYNMAAQKDNIISMKNQFNNKSSLFGSFNLDDLRNNLIANIRLGVQTALFGQAFDIYVFDRILPMWERIINFKLTGDLQNYIYQINELNRVCSEYYQDIPNHFAQNGGIILNFTDESSQFYNSTIETFPTMQEVEFISNSFEVSLYESVADHLMDKYSDTFKLEVTQTDGELNESQMFTADNLNSQYVFDSLLSKAKLVEKNNQNLPRYIGHGYGSILFMKDSENEPLRRSIVPIIEEFGGNVLSFNLIDSVDTCGEDARLIDNEVSIYTNGVLDSDNKFWTNLRNTLRECDINNVLPIITLYDFSKSYNSALSGLCSAPYTAMDWDEATHEPFFTLFSDILNKEYGGRYIVNLGNHLYNNGDTTMYPTKGFIRKLIMFLVYQCNISSNQLSLDGEPLSNLHSNSPYCEWKSFAAGSQPEEDAVIIKDYVDNQTDDHASLVTYDENTSYPNGGYLYYILKAPKRCVLTFSMSHLVEPEDVIDTTNSDFIREKFCPKSRAAIKYLRGL